MCIRDSLMASSYEFDSPNLPKDIALSPYIHDETLSPIVYISFLFHASFNIVKTLPLQRRFEREEARASGSKYCTLEKWRKKGLSRSTSDRLEPSLPDCTLVSETRLATMGQAHQISKILGSVGRMTITGNFPPIMALIMDYNMRPIMRSLTRGAANGTGGFDRDTLVVGYETCEGDVKLWHRTFLGPRMTDNEEVCVGSNHILFNHYPEVSVHCECKKPTEPFV